MRASVSIFDGDPSIKTEMQSLTTGVTVMHTIMENTTVQIGSAIYHSGLNSIIVAAIHTPILIIISPRACRKAASTLMFLFGSSP